MSKALAIPRDQIDQVIQRVSTGVLMKPAAESLGINYLKLWRIVQSDPELSAAMLRAREAGAEALVAQAMDIADSAENPHAVRNRINIRQWTAAKHSPRTYGDKLDLNVSGHVDLVAAMDAANGRIVRPVRDQPDAIDAEIVDKSTANSISTADYESAGDPPVDPFS